jgi:hypothetical protein
LTRSGCLCLFGPSPQGAGVVFRSKPASPMSARFALG